jgi:ABC-2 type transport system permease protein
VSVGVGFLLTPATHGARRRLREAAKPVRVILLGGVGLGFWALLFAILRRLLLHFRGADGIGELLAAKLLGLILLAFLSVLLLSNVIAALSTFFLARDLELLLAAPVDGLRVYLARLLGTAGHSSWMVVLILLPVLAAYGHVYDGGWGYLLVALVALLAFLAIPAAVGAAVTLLLVNIFPARRARDLLALLGLLGAAAFVVLIRLLRPEQLVRPEGFRNLAHFVGALRTPRSVWLPSEWAAEALMAPLGAGRIDLFPLLLLVSTAAAALVVGGWLHEHLYRGGFSRAQEGASEREEGGRRRRLSERLLRPVPVTARALAAKDIRTFFRDTTQWSQLVLLGVLVVVYIYNVQALPLRTGGDVGFFLVNVVSFLNLGLAGFVLAAIAARFIFPALSLEGRTLWLLRSAPFEIRTVLWIKYWVGVLPLLVLALAITIGTNLILEVGAFMMALSIGTIVMATFALAALAVGFGTLFPRLDADNAARISTGFGGLLFMKTALIYLAVLISLEAWPVYAILQTRLRGVPLGTTRWVGLVGGIAGAVILSTAAIVVPLRMAARRIESLELP